MESGDILDFAHWCRPMPPTLSWELVEEDTITSSRFPFRLESATLNHPDFVPLLPLHFFQSTLRSLFSVLV